MTSLSGKVAMITGGAKGLGEADARLFAESGAIVVVADVDVAAGEKLAQELGSKAQFLKLDVRYENAFRDAIASVVAKHGRLDILVNNAGVSEPGTPETLTEEGYRFVMGVSIDGTVFGCKHAITAMRATGGGSIINMSSVSSIQGFPYSAAYSAAKGAIEAYTRSVAVYCQSNKLNIRCNSVHPSGFATPMMHDTVRKMGAQIDPVSAEQYKKRAGMGMGNPREVAKLVRFLASEESSYINGQRLVIDNGGTVTPAGFAT